METNREDNELTANKGSVKVDVLETVMFEIEQSLLEKATVFATNNQVSLQELFVHAIQSTINKNT